MRPVFLTLLAVLLSSCYFCTKGSEINQNGNEFRTIQRGNLTTEFIDLDEDVLDIIFNPLELHELLYTAEVFPQLSGIIGDVFRRKYLNNGSLIKVYIHLPDRSISSYHPRRAVKLIDNVIMTNDRRDSISLLKYFGHFLENVIIQYNGINSDLKIINTLLNKSCLETLKHLQLNFAEMNDMEQLKIPFKGVEEFSTFISKHKLKSSMKLNELFPNLRQLNLTLQRDVDISFIDGQFSHLNQFRFTVPSDGNAKKRMQLIKQLRGMLMRNPTIQSIDINFMYPPNFLKFLSRTMSNLEHLKLNNLVIDNFDPVKFDNVKSFVSKMSCLDVKHLHRLTLPSLESLEMWYSSKCFDKWIQFLSYHTQLRQLRIIGFSDLLENIPHLNALTTSLPNLRDLTVEAYFYNGTERIAWFIQNNKQFEKVHFKFRDRSIHGRDVTALQQQLQDEWTVAPIKYFRSDIIDGFAFMRK